MEILSTGAFNICQLNEDGSTHYIDQRKQGGSCYSVSRSPGCLYITNLDNAFKTGKTCDRFILECEIPGASFEHCLYGQVSKNFDVAEVWALLNNLTWVRDRHGRFNNVTYANNNIYLYVCHAELKGVEIYSPFHLNTLKPVTALPEKPTLSHVKKLLANGQFKNLQCNNKFTDDYAGDAACNFGRGKLNPLTFLHKLVVSPSGWRVRYEAETNLIHVNCHHFDYNSFEPELSAEVTPIPTNSSVGVLAV